METTRSRYQKIVKYIALGLLLVVYMIVPIPIRIMGGSAGFDAVFLWTFGWIGLLFWIGACILWWWIVQRLARWRPQNAATWTVLTLLPVILIGGRAVYRACPSVRAQRVLYNADLAPLPPSANALKVDLWFTPFSGQGHLKFSAARDDIESFLATSPILRDVEYVSHAGGQGRYFYPRSDRHPKSPEDFQRYVSSDRGAPPWVVKELTESMTRYRIDPSGSQISGAVIVDEQHDFVFVKLSFD